MRRNLALTTASRQAKWLAAGAIILAVLVLALILDCSGAIQPYRLKTLDTLFRHVPLPAASPDVVVVTVDQPDLDFFKNQGVTWPWPRQLYAPLIDYCRWAGAKAVIFDILFTEASSYGPEDDQKLAQATGRGRQCGAAFFSVPGPKAAQRLGSGPAPQSRPHHPRPAAPASTALSLRDHAYCHPADRRRRPGERRNPAGCRRHLSPGAPGGALSG